MPSLLPVHRPAPLQLRKDTYSRLTPIQRLQVARHPNRPTFLDIALNISDKVCVCVCIGVCAACGGASCSLVSKFLSASSEMSHRRR